MNLNEYQQRTRKTAVYRARIKDQVNRVLYAALGLAGEGGEVSNQAKRILSKDGGQVTQDRRSALIDEAGDALWYAAALADDLGCDLEAVAQLNLAKLEGRHG